MRKETAEINASLYALKECVRMRKMQTKYQCEGGGHVHVPYRSSHLTRVLMECFIRPDAQLAVIGTVSPASVDTEHSVSTLKTVGLIGGREDGDGGVREEREDVSKNLKIGEDGAVTETVVERVVAPVRWSNAQIRAFSDSIARAKVTKGNCKSISSNIRHVLSNQDRIAQQTRRLARGQTLRPQEATVIVLQLAQMPRRL